MLVMRTLTSWPCDLALIVLPSFMQRFNDLFYCGKVRAGIKQLLFCCLITFILIIVSVDSLPCHSSHICWIKIEVHGSFVHWVTIYFLPENPFSVVYYIVTFNCHQSHCRQYLLPIIWRLHIQDNMSKLCPTTFSPAVAKAGGNMNSDAEKSHFSPSLTWPKYMLRVSGTSEVPNQGTSSVLFSLRKTREVLKLQNLVSQK